MNIIDRKSYTKFLEKIDINASVLKKSHDNLNYVILVENKGQSARFPFLPTGDLMDSFDEFISELESADTITVQIAHQDKIMRSIPYSFNPPKQAGNMTSPDTTDVSALLGALPQSQQLLGTVMSLSSKIERQNVESTYQQQVQMLQFEKMRLEDKVEAEKKEVEKLRADFAEKERKYLSRIQAFKNKVGNYESEDRALGHINIAKDVAKELFSGFLLLKASDADSEKKTDKYMTMAGLVSGASLPEKKTDAETGDSYVSASHDDKRREVQISLFEFLDSLDLVNFNHANRLIEFVAEPQNEPLIKKYIVPLIHGKLTE